jgi:hypothetical protein
VFIGAVDSGHLKAIRVFLKLRIGERGIHLEGIELEWAQSLGIRCSLSPEFIGELDAW